MHCLLSWYWEKYSENDRESGREALMFPDKEKAEEYAKAHLENDDTVLDYGYYVNILELKNAQSINEALKSRIASAIHKLQGD